MQQEPRLEVWKYFVNRKCGHARANETLQRLHIFAIPSYTVRWSNLLEEALCGKWFAASFFFFFFILKVKAQIIKWDDWRGSQVASQILCRAKKRERAKERNQHRERWLGVSSAMNEKKKKPKTMLLYSASSSRMHSSTDSSVWVAAGRGLCQGYSGLPGWRMAEGSCQWWTSDHNRRRHTLRPLIASKPSNRSSCRLPRGPHTEEREPQRDRGKREGEREDGWWTPFVL